MEISDSVSLQNTIACRSHNSCSGLAPDVLAYMPVLHIDPGQAVKIGNAPV